MLDKKTDTVYNKEKQLRTIFVYTNKEEICMHRPNA